MRTRRALLLAALAALIVPLGSAAESLYDADAYESLASDIRARRPGDLLTVLVMEESSARATASSDTDRSTSITARASGENTSAGSGELTGEVELANEFSGEGRIDRTGRLVARVSVRVEEVLPNGDLVVSGAQQLIFNQETQQIVVRGRVRPADIARDNTVLSTRLSDSTIEYTGEGILARAERKSWLSRLLDWMF